jgi:carboxyl-terminal processing protease
MTNSRENARFLSSRPNPIGMHRTTGFSLRIVCLALALASAVGAGNASESRSVGVDDLRAFADAWGYIKDHFVDEIDDRRLLEAAIRGMLSELDPHSAWLSVDDLQSVEEQATGRYGGLGIRITVQADHLQVITAMGDSPAERAGLRPGDRIVAIDSRPLSRDNADQATGWLRGAPGTLVALTVERDGEDQALEISLTRELIRRNSVTLDRLDDNIALVRIANFQQNTAVELDDALAELRSNDEFPAGLILDLRNNPGGMLQSAVSVSDRFLSDKLVVYADGRGKSAELNFTSNPGESLPGVPMVVLINRISASASEIVAGALQDHGRAVILGEASYGKGSVQTIWPLRNGGGMRLTTARYFTPSGRQIESEGIIPDVLAGSLIAPVHENGDRHDLSASDAEDPLVTEARTLLRSAERLYRGSGKLTEPET